MSEKNKQKLEHLKQQLQSYEKWLASKGVYVRSDLVETTHALFSEDTLNSNEDKIEEDDHKSKLEKINENSAPPGKVGKVGTVVAGWGCIAKSNIPKGEVLFRIPRGACFSDSSDSSMGHSKRCKGNGKHGEESEDNEDDVEDPTTVDSQKELALRLLSETKGRERLVENSLVENSSSGNCENSWLPFLDLLTPQHLPWTWPQHFRETVLKGTELECVVAKKVERVRKEYDEYNEYQQCDQCVESAESSGAAAASEASNNSSEASNNGALGEESLRQSLEQSHQKQPFLFSYQDYLHAASLVASHANPWFGVSIVPFNTTLNWGRFPNVEFDLVKTSKGGMGGKGGKGGKNGKGGKKKGKNRQTQKMQEMIIGKATRDIIKGEELFQSYGDSTAELVYRCGFAPCSNEGNFAPFAPNPNEGEDGVVGSSHIRGSGMENDVVSISIWDIVHIVETMLSRSSDDDEKDTKGTAFSSEGEQKLVMDSETPAQLHQQNQQSDAEAHPNSCAISSMSSNLISNLDSRLKALKQSGAIDESPWDGLTGWKYVTAELAMPSAAFREFLECHSNHSNGNVDSRIGKRARIDLSERTDRKELEESDEEDRNERSDRSDRSDGSNRSIYDDGGVSKLIGVCLVLLTSTRSWARAAQALDALEEDENDSNDSNDGFMEDNANKDLVNDAKQSIDDNSSNEDDDDSDEESRSDDLAASTMLSSMANLSPSQTLQMKQRALDVGMGGHDPWRALLYDLYDLLALERPDSGVGSDCQSKKRKKEGLGGLGEGKQSSDAPHAPDAPDAPDAVSSNGLPWKMALTAAKMAIQHRRKKLVEGEEACMALARNDLDDCHPNGISTGLVTADAPKREDGREEEFSEFSRKEKSEALATIQNLRNAEKGILQAASNTLEMTLVHV